MILVLSLYALVATVVGAITFCSLNGIIKDRLLPSVLAGGLWLPIFCVVVYARVTGK